MKIDTSAELREIAKRDGTLWPGIPSDAISKHTQKLLGEYQCLFLNYGWAPEEYDPPIFRKANPLKLIGFTQKGVFLYDQHNITPPLPEFYTMDLIKALEAIELKEYIIQ